jgi:uncharacterized protein
MKLSIDPTRLHNPPVSYEIVIMRLTESQRSAIVTTAREVFGTGCRVTLFGSRADDQARGGDIDLLVDLDSDDSDALDGKIRFLVALKKRIGDRKIDVVLRTPQSPPKPIYEAADRDGIGLVL